MGLPPEARLGLAPLAFLSARYWRRRVGRGLATVAGVGLGVGLALAVLLVNQAVLRTHQEWSKAVIGRTHFELRSTSSAGLTGSLLEAVRSHPGVAVASPVIEQRTYLFTEAQQTAVQLRAVAVATEAELRPVSLLSGRNLVEHERDVVLLSESAALALAVDLGDSVSMFTPDGLLVLRVVGLYGAAEPGRPAQGRTAMVSLTQGQAAFVQGKDTLTRIDVIADAPANLDGLQAELTALLGGAAIVRPASEERRELAQATQGLRWVLLLSGLTALVAAAFLISLNLLAAVEERWQDLSVLRAIGLPGRRAAGWLLTEAGLLGLAGSLVGSAAGALLATWLMQRLPSELMAPIVATLAPPEVSLGAVLLGAAAGTLISLTIALPVALQLRGGPGGQDEARAEGRGQRRLLPLAVAASVLLLPGLASSGSLIRLPQLGDAMLVLALVVLLAAIAVKALPAMLNGVGKGLNGLSSSPLWLRLAADSLKRHRGRTGATAASLMITLASLVGVFGVAASYRSSLAVWLDATVTWDLLVTNGPPGSNRAASLPREVVARLAGLPGVAAALGERAVTVGSQGRAVALIAFETGAANPTRRLKVASLAPGVSEEELTARLRSQQALALSTVLAARLGVRAGDQLTLATPDGERPFRVLAIVDDLAAESDAGFLDLGSYVRAWRDFSVDQVGLRLTPEADPAVVSAAAHALLGESYPVQVVRAGTYRQEVLDGVQGTFTVTRALVLMAVLVALAGLLNAILIGAWQLRLQLALLRALGAPVAMLSRTLAAEAAITTAVGAASGVALGTLLSLALLRGLATSNGPLLTWELPVYAYGAVAVLLSFCAVAAIAVMAERVRATPVNALLRSD